jgi:hypothetical protein
MEIAKKPKSNRKEINTTAKESAAVAFIERAEPEPEDKISLRERKIPILVRFDPAMLRQVDKAARRRGISRSAWIHFMVSRSLEEEG